MLVSCVLFVTEEGLNSKILLGSEMAVIVGEVRRRLSVAAVKAQADCLLNRMSSIGQGAVAAGKRRQWARLED